MRKLIALVMALMLCAMPFAGVAETEKGWVEQMIEALNEEEALDYSQMALANGRRVTTMVSVEDIADTFVGIPAIDQVIADLLGALQITAYEQEDEVAFAMSMKQATGRVTDLLSFAVASDEEGAYLTSNLLGNGVIYLKAIDVLPLMERVIRMMGEFGMLPMDAEELIKELKSALEAYSVEIGAAAEVQTLTAEELSALDFSELEKAVKGILEKAVTADVTMQPRNVDMAVTVTTLTVTPEDVKNLVSAGVRFVQANPALKNLLETEIYDEIKLSYSSVYGEIPTFDKLLEKIDSKADEMSIPGDVNISIWQDDKDMPVAAELTIPVQQTENGLSEQVQISYGRLTVNEGTAHTVIVKADEVDVTVDLLVRESDVRVQVAVAENGAMVCTVTANVKDKSVGNTEAYDMLFTLEIPDEQAPVNFTMKMNQSVVTDGVDFTEADTVTFGMNGKDYATLRIDVRSGEPGESIRNGRIICPVDLSEADFANWFVGVYNSLFSWLNNVLTTLPPSVMNLVTSLMY